MTLRKQDSYQTLVYDFLKFNVLVTCPTCIKKAIVKNRQLQPGRAQHEDDTGNLHKLRF